VTRSTAIARPSACLSGLTAAPHAVLLPLGLEEVGPLAIAEDVDEEPAAVIFLLPPQQQPNTNRKGAFDGPLKTYNPRGFIVDSASNATWGMRFIWPVKAEYLITYLTDDYSQTVIGRNKRDYVWIMARSPQIPEADYQRIVAELATQGYDVTKLRKVPQNWP
jgi:hypothetical protein